MPVSFPELDELLDGVQRRALHLEMRDVYAGWEAFTAWKAGEPFDRSGAEEQWHGLIAPVVARGVDVRRLRVVSEPVTDYIRFEYEATPLANLPAGERVRWLPRRRASDLAFPGNDFWLVDDRMLFNIFSGDGEWIGVDRVDDSDVVKFCASAELTITQPREISVYLRTFSELAAMAVYGPISHHSGYRRIRRWLSFASTGGAVAPVAG
jgi:hypothetical protein